MLDGVRFGAGLSNRALDSLYAISMHLYSDVSGASRLATTRLGCRSVSLVKATWLRLGNLGNCSGFKQIGFDTSFFPRPKAARRS